LAGDNDEEIAKDFDMRGIRRIEKNKDKKSHGSRKRKEDKLASNVSGKEFAMDLKDNRFAAVLDGDDGKFRIDRTDPQCKETPAMKEILDEQKARRKKKRKKNASDQKKQPASTVTAPPNVTEKNLTSSAGSKAFSSLVQSLKSNISNH